MCVCGLEHENDKPAAPAAKVAAVEGETLSRRSLLKGAGLAAAGVVATPVAVMAQAEVAAPAIAGGATAGLKFRAFIRQGTGSSLEELTLREIGPRQVLVRTTASVGCYTVTRRVLGNDDVANPEIPNHSGFGVVEAVGAMVRRVKVGDRVLVAGSPECGVCYQCLNGNPEACAWLAPEANAPIADLAGGGGVIQSAAIGGLSEYMVALEEYLVPVFTDLPDEQLCMLGDTFGVGIAATMTYAPVTPGSNVVIFGAGPVGLSAVQGANAQAAGQVIVIEPIAYRREKALEFGATTVIDPNEDPDNLVEQVRELCKGPHDNIDAGGRHSRGFFQMRGADYVIEAAGGNLFPPTVEVGPDPSGIMPLRQSWDVTRGGGHLTLLSAFQYEEISFPSTLFCLSTRSIYGGQMAGMHPLRDIPKIIRMMERGQVNGAALITARHGLDEVRVGFQKVADRTDLGVIFQPGS